GLAGLQAQAFQRLVNLARLDVESNNRLVRFLSLGVGPAGDDLNGIDLALELRIGELARSDLAIDDHGFLFLVNRDAAALLISRHQPGEEQRTQDVTHREVLSISVFSV